MFNRLKRIDKLTWLGIAFIAIGLTLFARGAFAFGITWGGGASSSQAVEDALIGTVVWQVQACDGTSKIALDGTTVTEIAQPKLYAAWAGTGGTLTLPNMQGRFIRAIGGNGPAAALGLQADATAVNGLSIADHANLTDRVGIAGGPNRAWFADTGGTTRPHSMSGDTETRPINIGFVPCVIAAL